MLQGLFGTGTSPSAALSRKELQDRMHQALELLRPEDKDEILGEYLQKLHEGADPAVVLQQVATAHPDLASEFADLVRVEGFFAEASATTAESYPDHLPDFRILREVARGGMGVVYEAEQLSLGRRVAVKVRRGRLSRSRQARFER